MIFVVSQTRDDAFEVSDVEGDGHWVVTRLPDGWRLINRFGNDIRPDAKAGKRILEAIRMFKLTGNRVDATYVGTRL